MNVRLVLKMGLVILVLFAAAVIFPQSTAADNDKSINKSPVRLFSDPDVEVGKSKLIREGDEVELNIKTSELVPGHAYTVWWVVFNNPGACGEDGCDAGDLFAPGVDASVLWATGEIASYNKTRFEAELEEGSPSGEVLFGPGLTNAAGAEIHPVIRDHGPASDDPDTLYAQLNTFGGGCDEYDCVDVQFAVHMAD